MSKLLTYKEAGVDKEAGYRSVEKIKNHVEETFTKGVLSHLGGFGGMFEIPQGYSNPVLVSGTDGVGTKLKIAHMMDKHDTIGIDCVAMCANDILCQGAKPLFFLDYIACGKNYPDKIEAIVKGVSDGCIQSGMALIGGETAEMPGMYEQDEYDIAGFAVGIVDKEEIISGQDIKPGDVLIGLPSSGVHSNGFSLVRKLVFEKKGLKVEDFIDDLGCTLGEALIEPTRIYVDALYDLIKPYKIKGMSHITGGGFYENIPRMIPKGYGANINTKNIITLPVFKYLQNIGGINVKEMYGTFNMGIGFVVVVSEENVQGLMNALRDKKENPVIIGEVVENGGGIQLCHE